MRAEVEIINCRAFAGTSLLILAISVFRKFFFQLYLARFGPFMAYAVSAVSVLVSKRISLDILCPRYVRLSVFTNRYTQSY